jgi:hypothetical protein
MIAVTLDAGAVADDLAALPGRADDALRAASVGLAGRLRAITERNLSGDVLNARSGKLRDSLAARVDLTRRIAATVTADTPYAAFQEYGFDGVETVRAHLRRQAEAFGRAIRPVTASVRAYDRRIDYPAHSYLRSALAELAPDIRTAIAAALDGALHP